MIQSEDPTDIDTFRLQFSIGTKIQANSGNILVLISHIIKVLLIKSVLIFSICRTRPELKTGLLKKLDLLFITQMYTETSTPINSHIYVFKNKENHIF